MGDRGFKELAIGRKCGVQTGEDRFGPGSAKPIADMIFSLHQHDLTADDDDDFDSDDGAGGFGLDGGGGAQNVPPSPLSDFGVDAAGGTPFAALTAQSPPSIPLVARTRLNLTALSQYYNVS